MLLVNQFASIVDGSPFSVAPIDDSDSTMYLRIGQRVPARELVERMIVRSSNLATNAVIALVGAEHADATAHALGAQQHPRAARRRGRQGISEGTEQHDDGARSRRCCSRRSSGAPRRRRAAATRCSRFCGRQEFNDEIPAGLPPGTRVAHKTGSITGVLHDAAIVYPPGRSPYVLVVLTREHSRRARRAAR